MRNWKVSATWQRRTGRFPLIDNIEFSGQVETPNSAEAISEFCDNVRAMMACAKVGGIITDVHAIDCALLGTRES